MILISYSALKPNKHSKNKIDLTENQQKKKEPKLNKNMLKRHYLSHTF